MSGDVAINLSKEVIEPIIAAKIQTAVIEALEGHGGPNLVEALAQRMLQQKVDGEGKASTRGYNNETPYIEWLCKNAVTTATREAIKVWVAENKPKIQEGIEKALRRQTGKMTRAFVDGLIESLESKWRFDLKVDFLREHKD